MPVTKQCERCGKTFSVPSHRAQSAKFCSIDCYHPNKSEEQPCVLCGKLFKVRPCEAARTLYCGWECYRKSVTASKQRGVAGHKTCRVCAELKPFEDFHKDALKWGGRNNICKSCTSAYHRARYAQNPDHFRRLTADACREKGEEAVRAMKTGSRRKLRALILSSYGGKCACCGETTPEFLTVDHIHNDGAEHRRQLGRANYFYVWLKRQGFPKDRFQLLCMNCNWAKSKYGGCPHQRQG